MPPPVPCGQSGEPLPGEASHALYTDTLGDLYMWMKEVLVLPVCV